MPRDDWTIQKWDGRAFGVDFNHHLHHTLDELQALPTLSESQADSLKIEEERIRVWLARVTMMDGAPYNYMVTIEVSNPDGHWCNIREYDANSNQ